MMSRFWMLVVAVVALAGCTQAPIRNVPDAAVVTGTGKAATPQEVRAAIVRAGSNLGWAMTPTDPGLVNGRPALRGHVAVVEVRYTAQNYSIACKESSNLDYKDGQIHKNYNRWIENLNRDIRANLLSL